MVDKPDAFAGPRRIPVIGIVGGIGSGKSAVAEWVAGRCQATVLNADRLGHEALESEEVKTRLIERFGASISGADGKIERAAPARQVFGNEASQLDARKDLEKIVHPEIGRRISEGIQIAAASGQDAVLLDAAILLEAGWRSKCDLVAYIDTPDAVRLERVGEHRGWTEQELKQRELSQWSLMDKRRESDLVISNDRDLEYAGQRLLDSLQERGLIRRASV